MKYLLHTFFLFVLLASPLGCSPALFESQPPAVKEVLVGLTNRYLGLIAGGHEKQVYELVYWPDFSENGELTLQEFHRQFAAIKDRWPRTPEAHPLLGLKVTGISGGGNFGEVRLIKDPKYVTAGSPPPQEIRVKLIWGGNGWVVRKDSLFGKNKYFAQFVPSSS